MNKGQIFSTDFLFAMILLLLGYGVLANIIEFNLYTNRAHEAFLLTQEKTHSALLALTNSPWSSCTTNNNPLAFSVNTTKLTALAKDPGVLKTKLGLQDRNIVLMLKQPGYVSYLTERLPIENTVALELEVLTCTDDVNYIQLARCMHTGACITPTFTPATIILQVGS